MNFVARAALIDLDGTLVDSVPDIASAVNAMRSELDRAPLAVEQVAAYIGKGVDVLVHLTGGFASGGDDRMLQLDAFVLASVRQ